MVKRPEKSKSGAGKVRDRDGGSDKREKRKTSGSSMYATGDDIIKKAKADAQSKKMDAEKRKAGTAFRFFVPKGEEKEIIILDSSVRKGLGATQHRLKDKKGHWNRYEPCIGADDSCPLCRAEIKASYTVMLTVLDLSGYTDKKGNEVPYSKRLLPITSNQLEVFLDLEEANGGSLRGMYLVMKRGSADTSYSIGDPKTLKGGKTFQVYSEEELEEEFGNPAKKDKKTQEIVKAKNADITPFDYKKLFPEPSEEYIDALRDEFDEGNQPAGSRKKNASSWDDGDSDEPEDDDDDKPKGRRSKPGSKGKASRNRDDDEDDDSDEEEEDDDDSDDEEEESPKSRRASSTKSAKKGSVRSRRDAEDEEDEEEEDDDSDDDEDDEEEKPSRKSSKSKVKPSARSRSSRDDEDEEEDDDSDSDDDDSDSDSDSDDEEEEEEKPAKGKGKSKPAVKGKREIRSRDSEDDEEEEDDDSDSDDEDDDSDEEEEERPAKKAASKAPAKKKPFSRR